jgi:hypothetical protein
MRTSIIILAYRSKEASNGDTTTLPIPVTGSHVSWLAREAVPGVLVAGHRNIGGIDLASTVERAHRIQRVCEHGRSNAQIVVLLR